MSLYFLMGTLSENGQQMLLRNPNLLHEAITDSRFEGAQILGTYAVLGRCDYVMMVEADDNEAVGRLALDGLVPNIQASWVKLGLDGASRLLSAGCNDFGGTLMNETISRAAGASHGQEVDAAEFESVISAAGRVPARRTTLYQAVTGQAQPVG